MNFWGNGMKIVACIGKNKGKFLLMGNVPDRKEFHVPFPNIDASILAERQSRDIEACEALEFAFIVEGAI
jgi:hypothetical protein